MMADPRREHQPERLLRAPAGRRRGSSVVSSIVAVVSVLANSAEVAVAPATHGPLGANTLTFTRNLPYRLHLENRGKELHEFTAPDFFKAVAVGNPEVLVLQGREVVLHAGEQKDVYLVPQRAGRYSLMCADHDWAGMTGGITIE